MSGPKGKQTEKKRKAGTVNRTITYLRTVLSYCVEIGWMARSPAIKKLHEGQRVRFLSDDELKALTKALEACTERVMLPFAYCAISSGARAGELLGLEWKDVDLAKGVAIIHKSKNDDGRKLYIRGQALDLLKDTQGPVPEVPGRVPAELRRSAHPCGLRQVVPRGAGESEDHRLPVPRPPPYLRVLPRGRTVPRCLRSNRYSATRTPAMVTRYAHLTESHVEAVVDRVMNDKLGSKP